MTQNKRFAVTGGIGSGKSTVLALLKGKGYPVFSCDEVYRSLCGEQAFAEGLAALFPDCAKNGAIERAALSRLVFSDETARKQLESYTHPRIMERLLGQMTAPVSFAEVPLLYEGGYAHLFDGTIAVLRGRESRLRAALLRDGSTEREVLARMAAQRDWESAPEDCIVLENNGTREELSRGLDEALRRLF